MRSLQRQERITSQTPAGSPDSVLVRQALTGDERAFESLVELYHRPLFGYIYSYLKDREQAYTISNRANLAQLPLPTISH